MKQKKKKKKKKKKQVHTVMLKLLHIYTYIDIKLIDRKANIRRKTTSIKLHPDKLFYSNVFRFQAKFTFQVNFTKLDVRTVFIANTILPLHCLLNFGKLNLSFAYCRVTWQ